MLVCSATIPSYYGYAILFFTSLYLFHITLKLIAHLALIAY